MDSAIRARQLYRRLVVVDPLTGEVSPMAKPNLEDLPEWVSKAWDDEMVFVSSQDDYAGVWVETPYVINFMNVFVRCSADTILINRGNGYIVVLGPSPWELDAIGE